MSEVVLGLDPSTRTGIAVVDSNGKVIHAEEAEFKKLSGYPRIQALCAHVFGVIETYKPTKIVIEEMIVGHASSAIPVIQIASILRYFLWQEGIKYLDVNPATLKKFVAGKGNATKEQVMMHVLKTFGYESKTNNIADAVALAYFGKAMSGFKVPPASAIIVRECLKANPGCCN